MSFVWPSLFYFLIVSHRAIRININTLSSTRHCPLSWVNRLNEIRTIIVTDWLPSVRIIHYCPVIIAITIAILCTSGG